MKTVLQFVLIALSKCDLLRSCTSYQCTTYATDDGSVTSFASNGNNGIISGDWTSLAATKGPQQVGQLNWWKASCTNEVQIQTLFITIREDCCFISPYSIYFGNDDANVKANSLIIDITKQGWHSIPVARGKDFWILADYAESYVQLFEIMAFNELFVQQNYYEVSMSTLNSGSSTLNAIALTQMKIQLSTYESGSTTNVGDLNPTYTVTMKAQTIIKRVVPIVGYNSGQYTHQMMVKFYDRNNQMTLCGSTSDANQSPDDSFSCNLPALKIEITTSDSILSLVSLGILSECQCTLTSFDPAYMPNFSSNFGQNSFQIVVGGIAQTTQLTLYDSISLVCGDGSGIIYCGSRNVIFYENDIQEFSLVQYNTLTGVVTVQATSLSQVGFHNYTIKVYLSDYSMYISLPLQFSVTVTNGCETTVLSSTQTLILMTATFGVQVSIQLVQSTDTVSTNKGTDTFTYCGARQISIVDKSTLLEVTNQFMFDDSTNMLTLISPSIVGLTIYDLVISLVSNPAIILSLSSILEITVNDPCLTTQINDWAQVLDLITLSVGDTQLINLLPLPTDIISDSTSINCGDRKLTIYENGSIVTSLISYSAANNQITIFPTLLTEVGVHNYELQISLVNYPLISLIETYVVTVTGCELTVLSWSQTMITESVVISQNLFISLVQSTDSVSYKNGGDGFTLCGSRTVQIIDDSTGLQIADNLVSFDQAANQILIQPTVISQIGNHYYSIQITLTSDPFVTLTLTTILSVTVTSGCENTVISWAQTFTPIEIMLFNQQFITLVEPTDTVSVAQSDPYFCYPKQITFNENGNVVDDYIISEYYFVYQNVIIIYPTSQIQVGKHILNAVISLTNNPSVTFTLPTTFEITIKSGCELTTFNEWSTSDYSPVTINNKNAVYIQITVPTDTVSFQRGQADGITYCGDRVLVAIDSATNNQIDLTGSSVLIFDQASGVLTINPTQNGVFTYSLYFYLYYYPEIGFSNTQTLIVNIFSRNLPPYFIAPPAQTYTIAPTKQLILEFLLVDDELDTFTIQLNFNKADKFTSYYIITDVGIGYIFIQFKPLKNQRLDTFNIEITVTEVYNEATNCINPSQKIYKFDLKVDEVSNQTKQANATTNITTILNVTKTKTTTKQNANDEIYPVPKITSFTQTGIINIVWDQNMNTTRNLTPQDINIVLTQFSDQEKIPKSLLDFSYSVKWINQTLTEIIVIFKAPQYLSADLKYKDYLSIYFNSTLSFISIKGKSVLVQKLGLSIPRQLDKNSIQINKKVVVAMITSSVSALFILSPFLLGLLSFILQTVQTFAIIINLFTAELQYPVNLQNFLGSLFPLITFDIFSTDILYEYIFSFTQYDSEPLSEQFKAVGYNSQLIVPNMGSMFLFIVIGPLVILVNNILKRIRCMFLSNLRLFKCIFNLIDQLLGNSICNTVINFIQSNYIVLTIISLIQIQNQKFNGWSESFCVYFAIIQFVILCLFPLFILILYAVKMKTTNPLPNYNKSMTNVQLENIYGTTDDGLIKKMYKQQEHSNFIDKYGVLLQGLRIGFLGKLKTIMTVIVMILYKFCIGVCVFLLRKSPLIQIIVLNQTTLLYLMYIVYVRPFSDNNLFYQEISQCIVILIIQYHLYLFTDIADIETQSKTGNSLIVIIILQTVAFFSLMLIQIFRQVQKRYKRYKFRKQQLKIQANQVNNILIDANRQKRNCQSQQQLQNSAQQNQLVRQSNPIQESLNQSQESQFSNQNSQNQDKQENILQQLKLQRKRLIVPSQEEQSVISKSQNQRLLELQDIFDFNQSQNLQQDSIDQIINEILQSKEFQIKRQDIEWNDDESSASVYEPRAMNL